MTAHDPIFEPDDYRRVEAAIAFLDRELPQQPELAEVAAAVGLSPFHFQRLFRRWAGVSPKRFLQLLTVEHAKALLEEDASVLDAALDSGLSGPGRLHDHFVTLEAVTPGEFKRRGEGLEIAWGVHPSPFGPVFVAATGRGLCQAAFLGFDGDPSEEEARLARSWSAATLRRDDDATGSWAARLFDHGTGRTPLLVQGTNFQVQVWRALLRIPEGRVASYGQIARVVGRPRAARAVGAAVGANPVAVMIPCHRVIRGLGAAGGYRWGEHRKRALLGWEAARRESA